MPIHPVGRNYTQTLKEDREAVLLADRLGYCEAYIGEHMTDVCESIPSCLAFIASLAHDTKQIKLGSGTVNLPNNHPVQVAAKVAMVDHMLEGRFIFGIGPGGLRSDMEVVRQPRSRPQRDVRRVHQSDPGAVGGRAAVQPQGQVLEHLAPSARCCRETGMGVMLKPYQQPHPPIVVTVVVPHSKGVAAAAARGWEPISANFLPPVWVATHWPMYEKGCARGRAARRSGELARLQEHLRRGRRRHGAALRAKSADGRVRLVLLRTCSPSACPAAPPTSSSTTLSVPDDGRDGRLHARAHGASAGSVISVVDQLLAFRETDRRFRHAALLRPRLGRSEARAPLDGVDGGEGDACRQRGASGEEARAA